MLADWQIVKEVEAGLISPFHLDHLNPASYDLTLASTVRVAYPTSRVLDVADIEPGYTDRVYMVDTFTLDPGEFMLAATNEVLNVPAHLVARVEGKSSLGRIGLAVHITAGFIDCGFHGSVTLEIANLLGRPITLHRDMRIAQVAFTPMSALPHQLYGATGHYQNQPPGEPVESRYKMTTPTTTGGTP